MTHYDTVCQISITKLREWGYLDTFQIKVGTITWSNGGEISITSNMMCEPYIELSYKYADKTHNHRIRIVSIPSNIGNGRIMYFLCPYTYKRCRKLYFISGCFTHRDAFSWCMYSSQARGKGDRSNHKFIETYFRTNKIIKQLTKKHLKKQYAGRPTKKYSKLMAKLRLSENIPYHEYLRILR